MSLHAKNDLHIPCGLSYSNFYKRITDRLKHVGKDIYQEIWRLKLFIGLILSICICKPNCIVYLPYLEP